MGFHSRPSVCHWPLSHGIPGHSECSGWGGRPYKVVNLRTCFVHRSVWVINWDLVCLLWESIISLHSFHMYLLSTLLCAGHRVGVKTNRLYSTFRSLYPNEGGEAGKRARWWQAGTVPSRKQARCCLGKLLCVGRGKRGFFIFLFLKYFKIFYWGRVDLQCCVSFRCKRGFFRQRKQGRLLKEH